MERTLVIVKPDGIQRGLVGRIIQRLEQRGLRIAAMKLIQIDDSLARRHYAAHEGRPFFSGLIQYITSGPVVVAVMEGTNAVNCVRQSMGATDPAQADPGTIRADLALEIGRNLVHGSDSLESASKEIEIFFSEGEICRYERSMDQWLFEPDDEA